MVLENYCADTLEMVENVIREKYFVEGTQTPYICLSFNMPVKFWIIMLCPLLHTVKQEPRFLLVCNLPYFTAFLGTR